MSGKCGGLFLNVVFFLIKIRNLHKHTYIIAILILSADKQTNIFPFQCTIVFSTHWQIFSRKFPYDLWIYLSGSGHPTGPTAKKSFLSCLSKLLISADGCQLFHIPDIWMYSHLQSHSHSIWILFTWHSVSFIYFLALRLLLAISDRWPKKLQSWLNALQERESLWLALSLSLSFCLSLTIQ